jgi:hypothetical protein
MHPLVNVTELTDKQLEDRIQELSRKFMISNNAELRLQVLNILNMYKQELGDRRFRVYQEQFNKQNDKGLDNLISIS